MSEPKFTPGPWRVVIDDDGNPLSGRPSIVASDELDCSIVHWDGFVQTYWRSARGDKEIHANAHLIAAAPDMYEALKKVAGYIEGMIEDGCPHCGGDCSAANPPIYYCPMNIMREDLAEAKVAIAKAEGKI